MKVLKDIAVIDLFCGIGGLTHGFMLEDFDVVAGFDNDPKCKYAYEINNKSEFILKDVQTLEGDELNKLFGDKLKILVGCAPCQPFSSYSYKQKDKDENKWGLLYSFARLIKETKPTIVSMENVSQLLQFKNPPVFEHFCEKLKSIGYSIKPYEVFCPDYGVPQRRKRLVLLASLLGEIKLIEKTHTSKNYVTVRQTISSLPPVEAGETDENDPTMTTHCTGLGNGRFGHPEQNRAISLREASLFQTFPMSYKFIGDDKNYNIAMISRHIGNAVPPLLGQVIAKSIKAHLQQHNII
ncbi:MAG: DNA (cytosine-5-)-methyltransferase [Ignavibacteriae bacterium]|nr:DNA (cytosine-5-)-methyltransferase [Ignavibacteriota bacterium]